jgi:hypothetical protein
MKRNIIRRLEQVEASLKPVHRNVIRYNVVSLGRDEVIQTLEFDLDAGRRNRRWQGRPLQTDNNGK